MVVREWPKAPISMVTNEILWPLRSRSLRTVWYFRLVDFLACAFRAAERIVGAQGKYMYKKMEPILCERGLGARPQKILRFYML